MKLNEVLDVFGNESLETVVTPEQEFEASVESIIEEIDNIMSYNEGLESLENEAVEQAKVSCESLLSGLVMREIEISNEDVSFKEILRRFNVKPELFGLEANDLVAVDGEKAKTISGGGTGLYSRIKGGRIGKVIKNIINMIKRQINYLFSTLRVARNAKKKLLSGINKGIDLLKKSANDTKFDITGISKEGLKSIKKGMNSFNSPETFEPLTRMSRGSSIEELQKAIKDCKAGLLKASEFDAGSIAETEYELKNGTKLTVEKDHMIQIFMMFKDELERTRMEEAGAGIDAAKANVLSLLDTVAKTTPGKDADKDGFEKRKYVSTAILKDLLKQIQELNSLFKKNLKVAVKSVGAMIKAVKSGKSPKKEKEATESVLGIESLDMLFGEIGRINDEFEHTESTYDADYGVEAAEVLDQIDELDSVMEAVEAVEEMYIEATIPSQIAALESIAIEKGLNPDNGVSFDLFGTMSAGIEAADEVVENASEETKKTMKERAAGAASKVAKSAKAAWAFVVSKFQGFKLIPRSLAKMIKVIEKMDEDKFKDFIENGAQDVNNVLNTVYAVKTLSQAIKSATSFGEGKEFEAREFNFNSNSTKEEVLAAIKEAQNEAKTIKIPKGTAVDISKIMKQATGINKVAGWRNLGKKVSSSIKSGLSACKNALKRLVSRKSKEEAPVEA